MTSLGDPGVLNRNMTNEQTSKRFPNVFLLKCSK